mmetsp:Transcript_4394/g.12425  ORF Transcript_4394/g.12425 Transcript_4394/m.12425 type:complete len:101 (-) Transcript_4394:1039-1341(-)
MWDFVCRKRNALCGVQIPITALTVCIYLLRGTQRHLLSPRDTDLSAKKKRNNGRHSAVALSILSKTVDFADLGQLKDCMCEHDTTTRFSGPTSVTSAVSC